MIARHKKVNRDHVDVDKQHMYHADVDKQHIATSVSHLHEWLLSTGMWRIELLNGNVGTCP
jgi:hypothetical protein